MTTCLQSVEVQPQMQFATPAAARKTRSQGGARRRRAPEPMRDPDLVYLYDDSLEGLLTAIFMSYARKENPGEVMGATGAQLGLLQRGFEVETDEALALRVRDGVIRTLGTATFDDIERVFLADDPNRSTAIYRFVRRAMARGVSVRNELAHEDVQPFAALSVRVANECEKIRQFTRFAEVEGGVYFARISPHANLVPLVMGYFGARMGDLPFVLYDERHHMAGLWDGHRWVLRPTEDLAVPSETAAQDAFAEMWRTFYAAIAIKERENDHLRKQLMPMRYWPNMTEFQPSPKATRVPA